jgi:hypothetical protein
VCLDEPDVVEHRPDVQQLGVILQALAGALQGAPGVDTQRVVLEQIGLDASDQLGGLTRQPAVGDRDRGATGGSHRDDCAGRPDRRCRSRSRCGSAPSICRRSPATGRRRRVATPGQTTRPCSLASTCHSHHGCPKARAYGREVSRSTRSITLPMATLAFWRPSRSAGRPTISAHLALVRARPLERERAGRVRASFCRRRA